MFATISEALLALPIGADAIAEHLGGQDIKAECSNARRCALAVYLAQNVSDLPNGARVGYSLAGGAADDGWYGDSVVRFADIDRADLSDFIAAFDDEKYPALLAEPVAA